MSKLKLFAIVLLTSSSFALTTFAQNAFYTDSSTGVNSSDISKIASQVDVNTGVSESNEARLNDLEKVCDKGQKLTFSGSNWACVNEEDPSVIDAVKRGKVPLCTNNQVLTADGNTIKCTFIADLVKDSNASGTGTITQELDPTVVSSAKTTTIPTCTPTQVITASGGQFVCVNSATTLGDIAINDLSDVTASAASTGDFLYYNGTEWVNKPIFSFAIKDYTLGDGSSCNVGEVLTFSGNQLKCVDASAAIAQIKLNDLYDVNTAVPPTDGDFLTYDSSNNIWLNSAPVQEFALTSNPLPQCQAGEVLSTDNGSPNLLTCIDAATNLADKLVLDDLSDVSVSTATDGQFLTFNGSEWVPVTYAETDPTVEAFAKNALPVCPTGSVLTSDSSNTFSCVDMTTSLSGKLALDDLSDVSVFGATNGQILSFNGSDWVSSDELDPTVVSSAKTTGIPTCTTDQVITVSGGQFVCVDSVGTGSNKLNFTDLGDTPSTYGSAGQMVVVNPTGDGLVYNDVAATPALSDLTDTTITAASSGDVLVFDGTNWVNQSAAASVATLYTADGTLASNRTVSGASNSLNFDNLSEFSVSNTPNVVIGNANTGPSVAGSGSTLRVEKNIVLGSAADTSNYVMMYHSNGGLVINTPAGQIAKFSDPDILLNRYSSSRAFDANGTALAGFDDSGNLLRLDPSVLGSSITFASLADTPSSYGTAGQMVVVNPTGDGLVYSDVAATPALSDLTDTVITAANSGDVLTFDGSNWVNTTTANMLANGTLVDLSDTPSSYGTDGQVLTMNAAGNATVWSTPNTALSGLTTDVALTTPTSSDVLTFDGTNWVNAPITTLIPDSTFTALTDTPSSYGTAGQMVVVNPTGDGLVYSDVAATPALSDLTDTTITAASSGDVLTFDGSNWVNTTTANMLANGTLVDLSDTPSTYGTDGQVLTMNAAGNATVWSTPNLALSGLTTDVALSAPTSGDVLTFNGTNWVNTSVSGAVPTIYSADGSINEARLVSIGDNILTFRGSGPNSSEVRFMDSAIRVGNLTDPTQYLTLKGKSTGVELAGNLETFLKFDFKATNKPVTFPTYGAAHPFETGEVAIAGFDSVGKMLKLDPSVLGSSITFASLADTPVANGTTGQILSIDGAGNIVWSDAPATPALNDLTDTTITAANSGDVLVFDGANWVNTTTANMLANGTLVDLSDTPSAYGTDGQVLTMNAAGNATVWSTPNTALAGLTTDVALSAPVSSDVLTFDGTNWVNAPITTLIPDSTFTALTDTPSSYGTAGQMVIVNPTGDGLVYSDVAATPALSDLTDTVITAANSGDVLVFDGANWVNTTTANMLANGTLVDLSDTPSAYGTDGQVLTMNAAGNATVWSTPNTALAGLTTDVALSAPNSSDVLTFDGTNWVNAPITTLIPDSTFTALTDTPSSYGTAGQMVVVNPTGDGLVYSDVAATPALSDLTDTVITAANSGDVLTFDGSNWVNTSVSGAVPTIYSADGSINEARRVDLGDNILTFKGSDVDTTEVRFVDSALRVGNTADITQYLTLKGSSTGVELAGNLRPFLTFNFKALNRPVVFPTYDTTHPFETGEVAIAGFDSTGKMLKLDPATIGVNTLYTADGTITGKRTVSVGPSNFVLDGLTGNIGIGNTAPSVALDVNGVVNATNFVVVSDRRLKKDINNLDSNATLSKILQVQGVSYRMKDETKVKTTQLGVIAQDIQKLFPEAVINRGKFLSVNYIALISPMIESIKAQQAIIDNQNKRIYDLEQRMNRLERALGSR